LFPGSELEDPSQNKGVQVCGRDKHPSPIVMRVAKLSCDEGVQIGGAGTVFVPAAARVATKSRFAPSHLFDLELKLGCSCDAHARVGDQVTPKLQKPTHPHVARLPAVVQVIEHKLRVPH
jgi:hypothetical protein